MSVDTLKLYERFSKAGMTDAAAKEVAEAIKESNDDQIARLVTKDDLKAEVARLEVHLIKWMIGIGMAGFGGIVGLLKLLNVL